MLAKWRPAVRTRLSERQTQRLMPRQASVGLWQGLDLIGLGRLLEKRLIRRREHLKIIVNLMEVPAPKPISEPDSWPESQPVSVRVFSQPMPRSNHHHLPLPPPSAQ